MKKIEAKHTMRYIRYTHLDMIFPELNYETVLVGIDQSTDPITTDTVKHITQHFPFLDIICRDKEGGVIFGISHLELIPVLVVDVHR